MNTKLIVVAIVALSGCTNVERPDASNPTETEPFVLSSNGVKIFTTADVSINMEQIAVIENSALKIAEIRYKDDHKFSDLLPDLYVFLPSNSHFWYGDNANCITVTLESDCMFESTYLHDLAHAIHDVNVGIPDREHTNTEFWNLIARADMELRGRCQ